jgi:Nickel responsive protein SCO4226-like
VREFLVELYVPRADPAVAERDALAARLAADDLSQGGTVVRYLRSIFTPEDETCFLLFEAGSADDVRQVAARALLPVERILEATRVRGVAADAHGT